MSDAQLKILHEQQQVLLKKQSIRLEQLQLQVMTAQEELQEEKRKTATVEQQLLQMQKQYTQLLQSKSTDATVAKEHERLLYENEDLKKSYRYLMEHNAEQQLTLESDMTTLKGKLQLLHTENVQLKKAGKVQSEELTISQQHVQQLINEKQALQMELQQANEQIETIQYEKQLLEQIQVTELQVLATPIETRIANAYTNPKLAEGNILLGDFLQELQHDTIYPEQLTELVKM